MAHIKFSPGRRTLQGARILESAKVRKGLKLPGRHAPKQPNHPKSSPVSSRVAKIDVTRVQVSPKLERSDEASLATRIAGVKLLLAILNIAVVVIDDRVPSADTEFAYFQAMTITGIFLAYMLVSYVALKRNWVSIQAYRVTGPFVDVIFCSLLIIGTDGYLSPFILWLAMCLVAASFCSNQRIVLSATGLALVLEVLIGFIPQSTPLALPVFVVRTVFLLAFGLVIASIGNLVSRKSAFLGAIDAYGSQAALCDTVPEAAENLIDNISSCLRIRSILLVLEDGSRYSLGDIEANPPTLDFAVSTGTARYGILYIAPESAVTSEEARLLHTMIDRFSLSLRRFIAADELRRSAAQEGRLRLADELHDTHVQTLTAIDFQIEALLGRVRKDPGVTEDLQKMRQLARQSIVDLRDFIANGPIEATNDLGEIIERTTKNWKGEFIVRDEPDPYLGRAAWLAIEVMLREGLANARQHAQADWALFTLKREGDRWIAELQTNGQNPELPLKRKGYGLTRVAAAVAGASGEMEFRARDEGGAVLSATFREIAS